MYRFATTFTRTLAILALASLAGCDDVAESELDLEFRDGLPEAGIPWDHHPTTLSFSIPMQPVAKYKPKQGFSLHGPTDLAYVWTPDPTGDPDAILVDANGVSPYSGNLPWVDPNVCVAFLEDYSFEVPVIPSTESCAEIESGCCDYVCYLWGGTATKTNGQNNTSLVDNTTFKVVDEQEYEYGKEMVWGTYVDPGNRMTWDMDEPNGGYGTRETVCACDCELELGLVLEIP